MRADIDEHGIAELAMDPLGPVGQVIEQKTLAVEGVMEALLLIPGSGRTYTTFFYRGRQGRPLGGTGLLQTPGKLYSYGIRPPHTASAPGMPPASDTGSLLASIGSELLEEDTVKGRVHADKVYALYLEYGTRYMAPRPFMLPALEAGVKL